MSWASDNPEKYIELQAEGVLAKLRAMPGRQMHKPDEDWETSIVWELAHNSDAYHIWRVLTDWADDKIHEAEGNYFGGLVDDAKERIW